MVKHIYERLLDLIERYNSLGLIFDDITVYESKDGGFKVFKSKISAAEKLQIFDKNRLNYDHDRASEILTKEWIRLARLIFFGVKGIIKTSDKSRFKDIQEELEKEVINKGWEENIEKYHEEMIKWSQEKLLELGIDSPYEDYILQQMNVRGMPFGTKILPKQEKTDKELLE